METMSIKHLLSNGIDTSRKVQHKVEAGTLRPVDVILKKRNGGTLSAEDTHEFIRMAVDGTMSESQIGAMLMAIFLNGLTIPETVSLTRCMIESGETLTWNKDWQGLLVDKHSTGGVGDKVSLVLAPALAACGLKVPMISGRGLGHTGGTLDKLESIPGLQVTRTPSEIRSQLDAVGACIVGQTNSLVPADKVLYSLRDTTGTVDNLHLIAASIMSKKAAEGINALVLEVTFGKAAHMKTEDEAKDMAQIMVNMGDSLGMNTRALLTRMDSPIGNNVGNALEVTEAVQCLNGGGPASLTCVTCKLGGELLKCTGKVKSSEEAEEMIERTLHNGTARKKFIDMLCCQGVDRADANALCNSNGYNSGVLPQANYKTEIASPRSGYIHEINALSVGAVANRLGAGRRKPGDSVNHAVGVQLTKHSGEFINNGDVWAIIHHDCPELNREDLTTMEAALRIQEKPPREEDIQLVTKVITAN